MSLTDYIKKRNFKKTSEPKGAKDKVEKDHSIFVIQKHDASHLHFDFRLEVAGVLKSWAVPKGPSLNPKQKRLAMMVEDHPYSYRDFEGTIPKGSYGAGEVIVWDTGTYSVKDAHDKQSREQYMLDGIAKGEIKFILHGQKVNGKFALIKMHGKEDNMWLLIKEHDEYEITTDDDFSQVSVMSDQKLSVDGGNFETEEPVTKPTSVSKKKTTGLPSFFKPMLAILVDEPFTDKDWIYENKLDGYRTLAFIDKSDVQLFSRNEISLNKKFPSIVKALQELPVQAVIDGEVVGVNKEGKIDFQVLQNSERNPDDLYYYVFDLTFLEGQDIKHLPLTDRKKLLKKVVAGIDHVKYVEDFKDGEKLFDKAKKNGSEGIIAKKAESPYRSHIRSEDWLKIKITHQQDAIICGYTEPQGTRHYFGSLLLGVYQDNVLHYIGHTGTGFPVEELSKLKEQLDKLKISQSPFHFLPPVVDTRGVTWVKPKLVCEVKHAGWTNDHLLRQAVYLHLRTDKEIQEAVVEKPETVEEAMEEKKSHSLAVHLSHPDKIYWPKLGLTKGDMLKYYAEMAPFIMPYLMHRPQSLNRFPNGVDEPGFFQKDIQFDVPDFVDLVKIQSDDVGETRYMVCNNEETLLYMANLGCIEINPWNSRVESLDHPDYLLIDLDPLEVPFTDVVTVAQEVKKVLDLGHIKGFVKTSGKKGMHIFIPLGAQYDTDLVTNFAQLIASLTHKNIPDITSLERSPSNRRGKVYIDYLQNRQGQTIAAAYSLRPTPEATASTPLHWDEVTKKLDPKKFTIDTLPKRVKKLGDVWEGMLKEKNDLKKALSHLK